jgi:hypothetical protein
MQLADPGASVAVRDKNSRWNTSANQFPVAVMEARSGAAVTNFLGQGLDAEHDPE